MVSVIYFSINYNFRYGWVHLKGTTLAEQLYEKKEIRSTGDIDILIDKKDLKKVMQILGELGYFIEDLESIYFEYLKNDVFKNHLSPLTKYVSSEKMEVVLELHTEIIPYSVLNLCHKNELTKDLLSTRIAFKKANDIIYILNTSENLIFLILHYMKHYIYELILGFSSGIFCNINSLNLIHDIALFIDKNDITWDKVISIANHMGVEPEVYFILKIENEIYHNIDNNFFNKMELKNNTTSGKIANYLSNINTTTLLNGDMNQVINNLLEEIMHNCPT